MLNPLFHGPAGAIAVVILIAFSAPVLLVLIVTRHRRAVAALRHQTALELAQRGVPVPPELLGDVGGNRRITDLRNGLVLSCTGVGAIAFALTLPQHPAWGIGLIPLFAGLGYIVTWLLSDREKSSRDHG